MKTYFYFSTLISIFIAFSSSAQTLEAPTKVNVYDPIVVKANVEKDSICLWRVNKPVNFISIENGTVLHVWAPPGKHEVEATIITVDWEKHLVSAKQEKVIIEVIGQNPPVPPKPLPTEKLSFILLLEESEERTVQMGRILNSQKLLDWLKTKKLTLNVVDDDVKNPQNQVPEQLKPYLMLGDQRPLLVLDSNKDGIDGVLFAGDFPLDVDNLIALLGKYIEN